MAVNRKITIIYNLRYDIDIVIEYSFEKTVKIQWFVKDIIVFDLHQKEYIEQLLQYDS